MSIAAGPTSPQINLSGQITSRLRQVARRRWFLSATVGVLQCLICGLIALLAAALVLGHFENLPVALRMLMAAIAWIVVAGSIVRFIFPAIRWQSLKGTAVRIEREHADFQERISSAIEIARSTDEAFRGSPELIAHLFQQAETDALLIQPQRAVPADRAVRWAVLVVPVLLGWAVLMLLPSTTQSTFAGLYRVLLPWKSDLPAGLLAVQVVPGNITIAEGDSVNISAHAAARNDEPEALLTRVFENGSPVTDRMQRVGVADYQLQLTSVSQGFAFSASIGKENSPWFRVTVNPRPQIAQLEVRCEFPAYTGLPAKVFSSSDAAIAVLAGTRVTFGITTTKSIVIEKSQVVFQPDSGDQTLLPVTKVDPEGLNYESQLTVNQSGQFRIKLTNEFGCTNLDEQPGKITVTPDQVPTIVIQSPKPEVTVGVDDVVPVKYLAHDDFGISGIDAVVQVDDRPQQVLPVTFSTDDKRSVSEPAFAISVAQLLKSQGNTEDSTAQAITYQLKVTDNRDPGPQFGYSLKQTLKIDHHSSERFEAREERESSEELKRAIQHAINRLNEQLPHMTTARDGDSHEGFENWRRKQLDEAAQKLPQVSTDLIAATDQVKPGAVSAVAAKAREIAEKQITAAAEAAARADLDADHAKDRKQAAGQAVEQMTQARDGLQKLLNDREVDKAREQAAAARDLVDAARKQQDAAEKMQSPEQREEAMRDQQQAMQKLQQALQQSEPLRDQQAQQTAQQLQNLIRKVNDLNTQQQEAKNQSQKQLKAADVRQQANAIAQKQEALNKEIKKTTNQNKQALQKANANPPGEDQQKNIVKALDRNDLQQAHDQMQQSANQLRDAQRQLQNQTASNDLHPNQQQQEQLNEDQQGVDQANQRKSEAQQAANTLRQNAANPQNDQAIAPARQTAQAIQQQAADLSAEQSRQDAKAAEQAADDAANATTPQEAQKHLQDAAAKLDQSGNELAAAEKKQADDHRLAMLKQQQSDAQAAEAEVAKEAQEQRELTDAAQEAQQQLANAQARPADEQTQQQEQLAHQTEDAKRQAEQLQKQAEHAKNANVAARAKLADTDLAAAQMHSDAAAKAEKQAARQQHKAAEADNAQQANQANHAAQKQLNQAADEQQQAQADLAKAQSDLQTATPSAQQARDQQQLATAMGDATGQPAAGQTAQQFAQQVVQQAAQAVQEAAEAQQDAATQNGQQGQAAAQQAANALNRAAQAMAQATQGTTPGTSPEATSGEIPGPLPGDAAVPTPMPGQTADSKEGVSTGSAPVSVPASVSEAGISADQWALLPALQKEELLNAAQQSGPPGYREMTKDYFAKIAKFQETAPVR